VEVPGGTLRTQIYNGKPRRRIKKLRNVNTGKPFLGLISYPGRRRVIKFDPDPSLNLEYCAELPPPTISVAAHPIKSDPEQAEAWKLAAELLHSHVDTAIMDELQAAADQYTDRPGALLLMLRRRRERGYRPPTLEALAYDLAHFGFR
ncbi:MAG TPA: hypothetical protein VKT29_03435, partial [Terriglobales bacterium]|nr:hypothetical protein [Terriglobales bacterium]